MAHTSRAVNDVEKTREKQNRKQPVSPHFQSGAMEEPLDISYYVGTGAAESLKTVEIVIGSGDIVTIAELPEDALELETFLQAESCAVKYWILVLQAYAQAGRAADGAAIAETGLLMDYMSLADKSLLHLALAWLRLALATEGADRARNIEQATEHLDQAGDSTSTSVLGGR